MRGKRLFLLNFPPMLFRFVVICAGVLLIGGCASTDERLLGSWKSNKALTVPTLHTKKPLKPSHRARLEALFGKLVLTYDRTHLTAKLPPLAGEKAWTFRTRYRITAFDRDSVTVASTEPITGERDVSKIHFEGNNRYWIYIGRTQWKEYFDRIK